MDGLLMVARWLHKWNIVVVPMAQWKAMNKEMEIYKATISSNFIPITSTSTQEFQDDTPPRKDDKLPPCPFCKGKPTLIEPTGIKGYFPDTIPHVTCKNEECELTDWIPIDHWIHGRQP